MKKTCVAALLGSALINPGWAAGTFDIAVTVDDLPVHGQLPPQMTRLGIAGSYLRTLAAHHVPEAYGFVNAIGIKNEPGSAAVLEAWRKAGYPLGNHTYSHMNLDNAASLDAWQADVAAGEPEIASRMAGADWHYLRFPYLAAGAARSDAALAYLRGRGYRVADVSLSFGDWIYSDTFARCLAKGDTATIEAMKVQYLASVDSAIAEMLANSQRVYGRVIPQVLLTHIGAWSAATLPDVLAKLDAAGAHYVTLAQAQADPAYAEPDGGMLIERTAKRQGISLAPAAAPVAVPEIQSLCR